MASYARYIVYEKKAYIAPLDGHIFIFNNENINESRYVENPRSAIITFL